MKKMITSTMIALLATVAVSIAATPDKAAMEAKEKAAWQAFKDKKAEDFKKIVDADFIGVYAEGVSDVAKEVSDMQKWDMKSFTLGDYKAVSHDSNTIVTTYTVTIQGTFDGKDASGTYNCGSVWKVEKGAWMAIFHTNVMQAPAAKAPG